MTKQNDVVIIGSGLGELVSAIFLGMKDKSLCVLEKNNQYGGNLQTFGRDKKIFDIGIMDGLQLNRMDVNAFDIISFEDDPTGQSINRNGVLGVTLGAGLTCSEILGQNYLVNKIIQATES